MSGRPRELGVKMTLRIPRECRVQIEELSEKMHISCNAVVRMAVARWYYEEPAINGKRSHENVDDHIDLPD